MAEKQDTVPEFDIPYFSEPSDKVLLFHLLSTDASLQLLRQATRRPA